VVKIETRCRIPIWQTFGRIQWHVIPEPHATWPTLQGVRIPSTILKIVFRHILFFVLFLMHAVEALTSGGFRIVSDTLVYNCPTPRYVLLASFRLPGKFYHFKGTLRRRIAYIFLVHLESIYYEIFFYSKIVSNCAVAK